MSTCETVTKLIAKSPNGINRVPMYLCALCRSDGSVIYPYCDRQMAVQGKSPNTRGMQGQKCNDCDLINSTQAYVLIVLWYAKLWLSSGSKGKVMKTEDPIGTWLIACYQWWHYVSVWIQLNPAFSRQCARLFQLIGVETHVLKKAGVQNAFGSAQNATFWKKLHFVPRLRTRKTIWSSRGP